MKNAIFWDVCSVLRLLVTANVVPNTLVFVTLMTDMILSSETVITIATRRNIPEDYILNTENVRDA
jgi:hypothetical protein